MVDEGSVLLLLLRLLLLLLPSPVFRARQGDGFKEHEAGGVRERPEKEGCMGLHSIHIAVLRVATHVTAGALALTWSAGTASLSRS